MRFFGKRKTERAPTKKQVVTDGPRQRAFRRCAFCSTASVPLAYCDNGRDYCRGCFFKARTLISLRSIGRRADDLQLGA